LFYTSIYTVKEPHFPLLFQLVHFSLATRRDQPVGRSVFLRPCYSAIDPVGGACGKAMISGAAHVRNAKRVEVSAVWYAKSCRGDEKRPTCRLIGVFEAMLFCDRSCWGRSCKKRKAGREFNDIIFNKPQRRQKAINR
jgi:hypothetical protein